jgi:hypothetical protein
MFRLSTRSILGMDILILPRIWATWPIINGFWIRWIDLFESSPVVTTNNYYTIADIQNLQILHTDLLSLLPLVFTIRFVERISTSFIVNESSNHTLILLLIYDDSVLQFNLQSGLNPSYRPSLCRHGTRRTENTVLLLRNLTTGHREPSFHRCLFDW